MFVVIFGRPGCPYCVRAKQLLKPCLKNVMTLISAMWIFKLKVLPKQTYQKPSVNLLKLCHKFLLMKNTLVAAQILKLMRKSI